MTYINVKPKDFQLKAAVIKRPLANKKKIEAQNIGGLGLYHIRIIAAMRLNIMPLTSVVNLTGCDL